jgi:putative nucleotidyltransferase with HDIG domain
MGVLIDVSQISRLAPMSNTAVRLVKLGTGLELDMNEVVAIVEYDGALTANLLRWANSAWSGAQKPIVSVREAVVRLGWETLLKVAVGHCVAAPMRKQLPEYALAEEELWDHGMVSALTVECLQAKHGLVTIPIAFTAALLHDIGKLLLAQYLSEAKLGKIYHIIKNEKLTYFEAEQRVLGTNHAQVGGDIARFWKFPETLVSAIEHHHETFRGPNQVLDMIQVANGVSKIIGIGLGTEQMNMQTSVQVLRRLGLDFAALESVCVDVKDRLAEEKGRWC